MNFLFEKIKQFITNLLWDIKFYFLIKRPLELDDSGCPQKCPHCKQRKLSECNYYHDDIGVVEYDVVCEHCKKIVAHWGYGYWDYWNSK